MGKLYRLIMQWLTRMVTTVDDTTAVVETAARVARKEAQGLETILDIDRDVRHSEALSAAKLRSAEFANSFKE